MKRKLSHKIDVQSPNRVSEPHGTYSSEVCIAPVQLIVNVSDSKTANDIKRAISSNASAKIVLVDLNNAVDDSYCGDVIYLIEPTTIKLNKLIQRNKTIFSNLISKKVILNKSGLLNNDVSDFEGEAGIKVFYNMPSLDERKRNEIIGDFLNKLGLLNNKSGGNSGGIFGLFRR